MYALVLLLAAVAVPNPSTRAENATALKPLPLGVVQVQVGTLHCPSCAKRIARNLYKTPGVMRVKTDMKRNLIWITVQPKKQINLAHVWRATHLKDVQPQSLRIGKQRFVAEDFEKMSEKASRKEPLKR